MKKQATVFSVVIMMLLIAATVQAQSKIELKVATIAPAGTPWVMHLEKWRDNLLEATNGNIELKIFPAGQLGNEFDVIKMTRRGRIDISMLSGGVMSEMFPQTALMSTPFLFDYTATIDCIYDDHLNDYFSEVFAQKQLKLIQWQETGWVYVYAKDNLSDVKTAKGYKARMAPHPMSRLLWTSVGANGIELPYIDTPPALQTGMVKAGESAGISYLAFGLNKVAPHLMLTEHMHQAGALAMNMKKWKKLSADQQKTIIAALPDVNDMRTALRGITQKMINDYKIAGGPVHSLTPKQRTAWKALVEPNWPAFVKELGPEAEELWPKVLEAKKVCSQ